MPTQIVLGHSGGIRYEFDAADLEALAKAEQRFKKLTGKGIHCSDTDGSDTDGARRSRRSADVRPDGPGDVILPRLVGG
jgi:hypothetical protein